MTDIKALATEIALQGIERLRIRELEAENEKYSAGMQENCRLRKRISELEAELDAERALADKLHRDIFYIANNTTLPDGDGVNMPTLIWAEEWAAAIRARGEE